MVLSMTSTETFKEARAESTLRAPIYLLAGAFGGFLSLLSFRAVPMMMLVTLTDIDRLALLEAMGGAVIYELPFLYVLVMGALSCAVTDQVLARRS